MSGFEDFLTRIAALRRRLEAAAAALERDVVHDLSRVPDEVAALCDLALRLEPGQRARAAEALAALDEDLAAATQQLGARRADAPQHGDETR